MASGFHNLSKERLREISRMGGKAAHAKGVAHQYTPEEARAAGRKGGLAVHRKLREEKEKQNNQEALPPIE